MSTTNATHSSLKEDQPTKFQEQSAAEIKNGTNGGYKNAGNGDDFQEG